MTPENQIRNHRISRRLWPLERLLPLMAGAMTILSAGLATLVSPWFLLLTAFVGAGQLAFVAFVSPPSSDNAGSDSAAGHRDRQPQRRDHCSGPPRVGSDQHAGRQPMIARVDWIRTRIEADDGAERSGQTVGVYAEAGIRIHLDSIPDDHSLLTKIRTGGLWGIDVSDHRTRADFAYLRQVEVEETEQLHEMLAALGLRWPSSGPSDAVALDAINFADKNGTAEDLLETVRQALRQVRPLPAETYETR